jgi:fumarate hydratase class II
MSVFDENRMKCIHCGDYINHWEQSSNDYHSWGICIEAKRKKEQKLAERITEMNRLTMALHLAEKEKLVTDYDYLLDLEHTLADI